jgi:hemolysin III
MVAVSPTVVPATGGRTGRGGLYSRPEELANTITHGVGAALALVGLGLLLVAARRYGNGWHLASATVYGLSMVMLYGSSTLYHGLTAPRAKHACKVLDHSSIYLLIAGTYTPVTLITLRASGGWWLFGVVWGCALVGIAAEAFWVYRPKWLAALVYVAMGWLVVLMVRPLVAGMPPAGLRLLVAGGLAYTLGTPVYALKGVRFTHAGWHLFVLAGSVCHFLAIYWYVLPAR